MISSRVTAQTGRNFQYQKTLVYTNRKSDALYQRITSDQIVMAVDPLTITLIASLVAGVLLAIASAISGKPIGYEMGIDPETKSWYVKTGNHEVIGDGGGSIPITPDLPSQQGQGEGKMLWIVAAIAGLMLLFFLWR